MFAKRLAVIFFCCLLSAWSWADQDEIEMNNDRGSANGPINFNESLRGTLQNDGGQPTLDDYWSFSATAGDTYIFTGIPRNTLPFGKGLDIDLAIENASGQTIALAIANGDNQTEILNWLCPADGTYYLVVFEGTATPNGISTYETQCIHLPVPVNAPVVTILGGVAVSQGGPTVTVNVATVTDLEDASGSLAVSAAGMPAGLTVQVRNNSGTVEASTSATCSVPPGTYPITLTVTDTDTNATDASFNVVVAANSAPTVGVYPPVLLMPGQSTTVVPSAAPADANDNLATVAVNPLTLPGGGTLAVDESTGEVSVATVGATTVGEHPATVTATDGCGADATADFAVHVAPTSSTPALVITGAVEALFGAGPATAFVAAVADAEDAADALAVAATSQPLNLSVTVNNVNGVIWAMAETQPGFPLSEVGQVYSIVLTVTDADTNSTSATFNVTVAPNPERLAVRRWQWFE